MLTNASPNKLGTRSANTTILSSPRKTVTHRLDSSVETGFVRLLEDQDVPSSLRGKLLGMDLAVKEAFLAQSNASPSTSSSGSPTKNKKKKHTRHLSLLALSPGKRSKEKHLEKSLVEPCDFAEYLTEHSPRDIRIEVMYKLRLLLRNERISWTESFLASRGAEALQTVCRNITLITWREEHDDTLLGAAMGCVQAICTTQAGRDSLTVPYLKMLTDLLFSERKPADFTMRGQILDQVEIYLADQNGRGRAQEILGILSDPIQPLQERPLEFLEIAYRSRPYKRWMMELSGPCRDCAWMFLHGSNTTEILTEGECDAICRRQPVVPEGYVGGVEWQAVEYICTHLSLINLLLSQLNGPGRQRLREGLRASHFERICGLQLRKASKVYYGYLHEELTIWASRAAQDNWPTDLVCLGREGSKSDQAHTESVAKSADLRGPPKLSSPFIPELRFD